MRLLPIFSLLGILFMGCTSTKIQVNSQTFLKEGEMMKIIQGGKSFVITETYQEISLKKAPFLIVFKNYPYQGETKKFHATSIVGFKNIKELDQLEEGNTKDETTSFMNGMGAAGPYGEELYIGLENTHQYLYYDPMKEQRANLVSKEKGGLLELSWLVSYLYYDKGTKKIEETDFEMIYLGILSDLDLDGIIEKGEFGKIGIKF